MFIYFLMKLFFLQFVCCLCKILTVMFWVMTLCNHVGGYLVPELFYCMWRLRFITVYKAALWYNIGHLLKKDMYIKVWL
jgi:hypothetical protein